MKRVRWILGMLLIAGAAAGAAPAPARAEEPSGRAPLRRLLDCLEALGACGERWFGVGEPGGATEAGNEASDPGRPTPVTWGRVKRVLS